MKSTIGNFEVGEPIGATPNARVFAATQNLGGGMTKPAAIKVLRIAGETTADRDEIRKEAEILVKLGTSPNVVAMLDYGVDDEVGPWLGMERLGESLSARIGQEPADPGFVRRVMQDALQGLSAIHNNSPSILHRDVKPAHLLSTPSGSWKLIDFGLAAVRDEAATLNLVTVQYAAPELIDRQLGAASPATDLYSLGMTLYHLALGEDKYRPEFPAIYFDDLQKWDDSSPDRWPKWMFWHCSMEQKAKPVAELIPGFPQDLSDAIAWMMTKPLEDRAGSAPEVLASLSGGGAVGPAAQTGPAVVRTAQAPPAAPAASGAAQPNAWNTPSPGQDDEDENASSSTGVSPLILALVAVVLLLAVGAVGFMMFGGGGASGYDLRVAPGQQGSSAQISVAGKIVGMPQGYTAELRTTDREPVSVSVDPGGDFMTDIIITGVGKHEVQLVLLDASGRPVADRKFEVERLPPASVDLIFQTSPPVPEANYRVYHPDTNEPYGEGSTDEAGRFEVLAAYGPFRVEIEHERYERFVDTGDTGANATNNITIPLKPSATEARFRILPPNAEVWVILADSNERVQIRLDSGGNAEQLLPLGRHVIQISAPGFVEEEHEFEVSRRTRSRFQEQLLRVGEVNMADDDLKSKDIGVLTDAQLAILPLVDLRDMVERDVGLAGLEVTAIPELNRVRVSGSLLNDTELRRLLQRVQRGGQRIQVEAIPNPRAIERALRRWIVDQGDQDSAVRAAPNLLFVRYEASSPITREALEAETRRYVYDNALVEVQ